MGQLSPEPPSEYLPAGQGWHADVGVESTRTEPAGQATQLTGPPMYDHVSSAFLTSVMLLPKYPSMQLQEYVVFANVLTGLTALGYETRGGGATAAFSLRSMRPWLPTPFVAQSPVAEYSMKEGVVRETVPPTNGKLEPDTWVNVKPVFLKSMDAREVKLPQADVTRYWPNRVSENPLHHQFEYPAHFSLVCKSVKSRYAVPLVLLKTMRAAL